VLGWRRVAKTTPKTWCKRRVLSVGMEGKGKGAVEGWGEEGVKHVNHALGVFDVMGKRSNTTNTPWGRVCCVWREGWVGRGDVEAEG